MIGMYRITTLFCDYRMNVLLFSNLNFYINNLLKIKNYLVNFQSIKNPKKKNWTLSCLSRIVVLKNE